MSVKIILSRTGEPAERRELVFTEETISIGRDPSNMLALAGTQVSKAHARIERQGSEYYIVDLNSTNFTYVNGEKLTPGKQHPLHPGERISISDYDLQLFSIDASSRFPESSTGQSKVEQPARATGLPRDGYQADRVVADPIHDAPAAPADSEVLERWSALAARIQDSLQAFNVMDIVRRQEELEARCAALLAENRKLRSEQEAARGNGQSPGAIAPAFVPVFAPTDDARSEQVMRVLLQLFFKLSSGRSSFLTEFIIRTVVRTSDGLPAQPRSDDEVLRYFTDARLSEKEFAERLTLLKKEADQIVFHMMGLLEGYRRSVDEGAHRILQRVDPDRLEEELPDTFALRYMPPLAEVRLFRLVRTRLRNLVQEDRGVLEKQLFRPGFVRAYEECVESATKP